MAEYPAQSDIQTILTFMLTHLQKETHSNKHTKRQLNSPAGKQSFSSNLKLERWSLGPVGDICSCKNDFVHP